LAICLVVEGEDLLRSPAKLSNRFGSHTEPTGQADRTDIDNLRHSLTSETSVTNLRGKSNASMCRCIMLVCHFQHNRLEISQ